MPRNSSGVYTLPAGNPVTSRTIIESSWANNTMSDIANEITESLARNGAGGMTGPMKAIDGTAAAPSITFGSEISTGLYRVTSGQLGITTGGVQRFNISSSGSTFSVPVTVNSTISCSGSAGSYTANLNSPADGSNNAYTLRGYGNVTGTVYTKFENTNATGWATVYVAANNSNAKLQLTCTPSSASIGTETNHQLSFVTNNTSRLSISNGGNVSIGTPASGSALSVSAATPADWTTLSSDRIRVGGTTGATNESISIVGANRGELLLGGHANTTSVSHNAIKFLSTQRSTTDENTAAVAYIQNTLTDGSATTGGGIVLGTRPANGSIANRLEISADGNITINAPASGSHTINGDVSFGGTVSGSGSGLTNLNASNISTGTLADARLSSNVPLKNVANTFTANQQINASGGTGLTVNGVSGSYAIDSVGVADGSNNAYTVYAHGNASAALYSRIENASATGTSNLLVSANNGNAQLKLMCAPGFTGVGSQTNHQLRLITNDTDRVTISTGGNVTINSPTSGAALSVSVATPADWTSLSSDRIRVGGTAGVENESISVVGSTRGVLLLGGHANTSSSSHNGIKFISTQRSTTDENVAAVAYIVNTLTDGTSTTGGGLVFGTRPANGSSADRLLISANGNVTINAPVSGTSLYVYGDIYATGTITQGSDERLKTEIRTIDGALAKVCAMRGVSFTRKDTGKREVGVIAHEVAEVVPEVVSEVENGHLSVAYGNMVGVLIEAVKELRDEVWQLKAKYSH
jgi:hypothetical protein